MPRSRVSKFCTAHPGSVTTAAPGRTVRIVFAHALKKSSAMMPILYSWVRFFLRAEGKHTQFNHVKDQKLLHKQRSAHLLWRPKGGPRTSHEYFKLESVRSFKNVDNNTRSSETENRTRQQRCSCSRLPCGTSRLHVCDLNANGPILHFIFEPVSL